MGDERLVWWVDRCLGARTVPDALRTHGIDVRTYAQIYPHDDAVPDVDWIPQIAARGWIILTKDREIRRNQAELAALRAADARYVCLAAKNMRGEEQAQCLLAHWRTLEGVVRERRAPLIVSVTRSGVTRLDGSEWRPVKTKRAR